MLEAAVLEALAPDSLPLPEVELVAVEVVIRAPVDPRVSLSVPTLVSG